METRDPLPNATCGKKRKEGDLSARTKFGVAVGVAALTLFVSGAAIIGGILGIHSVRASQAQLTPYAGGALTQGIVVRVTTSCFRGCSYQPTIRYAVGASTYSITAPFQDDEPSVGDQVRISYEASNPARGRDVAEAPSSWDLPLATAFFSLGMGTLTLLAGLWLLLRVRTRSHRRLA